MNRTLAIAITAVLLDISQPATADLITGLAAHYTFDNCKASDNSGNNNNGTITGALKCIAGKENKALQFDGTSYISVPNSVTLNPDKEWTMAFWVRVDGFTNTWSAIIHKGGDLIDCAANRQYSVWLNDQLYFYQGSAGDGGCQAVETSKPVAKGTWLHYVGVIDRNKHVMKIYINGKLNAEIYDGYNSFNSNNADLRIGFSEENASWHSPFKGALDDIRLYNRVLSGAEIQALYNMAQPVSGSVKGLKQYSVTCTNTTTGLSKTIPLKDGQIGWNCSTAGLKSNEGDTIDIHLNGISW